MMMFRPRQGNFKQVFRLFCLMRGLRQLNIFYPPPPVVFATDLSKAVSRCCSYIMWLCGLYYWAIHVLKVFPCSLSSCFFIPFSIVITSLGEEGAGVLYLFVCFARVGFCAFSSSWCRWLAVVCDCGAPRAFLSLFAEHETNNLKTNLEFPC